MVDRSPIILAVDTVDLDQAKSLIEQTRPYISIYKFGLEFYLRHGLREMRSLKQEFEFDLFLDLKLHDIPNTVFKAAAAVSELEPYILTVHASGGGDMVSGACRALPSTLIAAVTILTSLDQKDIETMGFHANIAELVETLADEAVKAGASALVTSPHEVALLKRSFPSVTMITPGIRSSKDEVGDQNRVMSAKEAIEQGSDLLVVGRPITSHSSPGQAAQEILRSLE
jgi:orotidine-5'-phosphate decarboxylase